MNKFSKILKNNCLTVLAILSLVIAGCSKANDGAYYNFDNSNAIFHGNSYEFLESQDGLYDSLLFVIDRVGTSLKNALENDSLTLFAPTNQSFAIALNNLNELRQSQHKSELNLTNISVIELDTLICRYLIPQVIVTDSLSIFTDGVSLPSFRYDYDMNLKYRRQDAVGYLQGGPQEIVYSDPKKSIFERYWVTTYTTSVNIHTDNGVVHLLSGGHEFGFGEFTRRMNK